MVPITSVMLSGATILSAGGGESSGTTSYLQQAISGVNFMQVFDEIVAITPTLLPVIIAFIGFRKGLRFVIGSVKRA